MSNKNRRLGQAFRAARESTRLTRNQLADSVPCSLEVIEMVESGQFDISIPLAYRIARACGAKLSLRLITHDAEEREL